MTNRTQYSKTPYLSLHVKRELIQKTIISSTQSFRKKLLRTVVPRLGVMFGELKVATPTFYFMDRYTFISETCFIVQ